MNEEIIKQAAELFDSPEKWVAFWELHENAERIKGRLFSKFLGLADKEFTINDDSGLKYGRYGNERNIMLNWFFQESYAEDSDIWIAFRDNGKFGIYSGDSNSVKKGRSIIKEFSGLLSLFESFESNLSPPDYSPWIIYKDVSYDFKNEHVDNWNNLAGYAWKHPESLVEQLARKIKPFKDPQITDLLRKLNRLNRES